VETLGAPESRRPALCGLLLTITAKALLPFAAQALPSWLPRWVALFN